MDDFIRVRELIFSQFSQTYDKLSIFQYVCQEMDYGSYNPDDIRRWFNEADHINNPNITQTHLNVMMAIDEQHWNISQKMVKEQFRSKHDRVKIFVTLNRLLNDRLVEPEYIHEFLRSVSAYYWDSPISESWNTFEIQHYNGSSYEKRLLKYIDEIFWIDIVMPLIKQEVHMERSIETTFMELSAKLEFDPIPNDIIRQYFNASRVKVYDPIKLADHITSVYFKYKYTIGFCSNGRTFNVMPSNTRYGCSLFVKDGLILCLADLFHGQTR
jgi:hypothetical protein